jgi:hypothetical protein
MGSVLRYIPLTSFLFLWCPVTENNSSVGPNGLSTTLPEDGNKAGFQNVTLNLKNEKMDNVQRKKTVSVTFSHDLVMQALIWLHMVQFGASYAGIRQPHILKHQIKVKKKKKTCLALQ